MSDDTQRPFLYAGSEQHGSAAKLETQTRSPVKSTMTMCLYYNIAARGTLPRYLWSQRGHVIDQEGVGAEGVDLFEIFRGGEADFRGPGHDPQLFSIFAYALRGICVQPSFDQTDSVRLRFTESGDAFHVRQEAQHFDRAVIRFDFFTASGLWTPSTTL